MWKPLDFGYRRWNWGVTYRKEGTMKDKHFTQESEARKVYEKLKKYDDTAILFKFKPRNWLDDFMDSEIHWMGRRFQVPILICILMIFVAAYEIARELL